MFGKREIPSTIVALAQSIEARDPYTAGHTWRVSRYAVALAQALRVPKADVHTLELGAVLHDLGKITIADAVLHKPGKLNDAEFVMMKSHPKAGFRILASDKSFQPFRYVVEHHHERIDGKGYPDGLKGNEIPVMSRIMAIADTFDAMTSHRPYRKALPLETALQELDRCRASQFDSAMVDAFLELSESHILDPILLHSAEGFPLQTCDVHGPVIGTDPVSRAVYGSGCPVCALALNGLI